MRNKYIIYRILSIIGICVLWNLNVKAESFDYEKIVYHIVDAEQKTCEVRYTDNLEYSGDIEIPTIVEFEGVEYQVVGIGEYAFAGRGEITTIKLPESVRYIGRNAFESCTSLKAVNIPEAVTEIHEQTFYKALSLETVSLDNIISIEKGAFSNCHALSDIEFSPSLERLGDSAFQNCRNIVTLTIPDLTYMGINVFEGCSSLESIDISNLRTIPSYTFSGCNGLKEIYLPVDLETVGNNAFYGCSSLTDIQFPEKIKMLEDSSFALCTGLKKIEITGEDIVIGAGAFMGCNGITEVILDGVAEISEEAFANDDSITFISMNPTIQNIGNRAFKNCFSISRIICDRNIPPALSNTSFETVIYSDATLIVPYQKTLLYMQTPPWSYFSKFEELPDTGIDEILDTGITITTENGQLKISGFFGLVEVFSMDGRCEFSSDCKGEINFQPSSSGIYIIKCGDRSAKIKI